LATRMSLAGRVRQRQLGELPNRMWLPGRHKSPIVPGHRSGSEPMSTEPVIRRYGLMNAPVP
jgi:hypothetical protein